MLKRADAILAMGSPIRHCTRTFEAAVCGATYATTPAHGAAEALPSTDHPGVGRYAYCEDDQGYVFRMITPETGA